VDTYMILPKVDQAQEFLEIARDFTNPLEAVREAISNSIDAKASQIQVKFLVEDLQGEGVLRVILEDDGIGMTEERLQAFFDLGNSSSRGNPQLIGAKGHGTKVFYGCDRLTVETVGSDGIPRRAVMENPLASLYEQRIPPVQVEPNARLDFQRGTRVILHGFNKNRRNAFTHEQVRDYILWFTKFGSVELEFDGLNVEETRQKKLLLQGVDKSLPETVPFGHIFAEPTPSCEKLFDQYITDAPKYFARKWIRAGHLKNYPEIAYHAVFAIEGDSAKREYNPMLSGPGRSKRAGMYKVTERYGLYLCRDFIPIERTVGWLGTRSTDHLLYHAFINCQGFQLTANRGSVSNTPRPILDDIRDVADGIRQEIMESDDYDAMQYLQEEAVGHETAAREERQYRKRVDGVKNQQVATYKGHRLVAPRQESGVFGLISKLAAIDPDALPFEIVDYESSIGIDALVKTRDKVPVLDTELRYLELKYVLERTLNHSFKYLSWIVAWKLHHTLKHESLIEDMTGRSRKLIKVPSEAPGQETLYFLDDPRSHRIRVLLLEEYLKERLGVEFV